MQVKIILLLFFKPLLLMLLLMLIAVPIAMYSIEETGSRSTIKLNTSLLNLGNVSDRGRDFRFIDILSEIALTMDNPINPSNDYLIGKRVTSLTRDDSIRKKRRRLKRLGERKRKEVMNNDRVLRDEFKRIKRSADLWIEGNITDTDKILRMHAFIVRDEEVPVCDATAEKVTKTRYFMCSGVVLDERNVLTTATCINRAKFSEYHISADLAVLVGALEKDSYVIKIADFIIHPKFISDPGSTDHAKNNIALLKLSCPIPRHSVTIPKLPSNAYHDAGHLCCPDKCKLLTVTQDVENHHVIKELKMKHLPSPTHDDNEKNELYDNNSGRKSFNGVEYNNSLTIRQVKNAENDSVVRIIRTPGKAPTPQFFTKEMAEKLNSPVLKGGNADHKQSAIAALTSIDRGLTLVANDTERKDNEKIIPKGDLNGKINETIIDWKTVHEEIGSENVSQENKEKLSHFVKNALSDIMTKILELMTRRVAKIENVFDNFEDILATHGIEENKTSDELVSDSIAKSMLKMAIKELYTQSGTPYDNKYDATQFQAARRSNNGNHDEMENTDDVLSEDDVKARSEDDGKDTAADNPDETVEPKAEAPEKKEPEKKEPEKKEPEEKEKEEKPESVKDESEGKTATTNAPDINSTADELSADHNQTKSEFELNVECPPLGSPIFANKTLVALIAYTCDDDQNWVEWKYVNVVHNLPWIQQEMKKKVQEKEDFNSHNEISD